MLSPSSTITTPSNLSQLDIATPTGLYINVCESEPGASSGLFKKHTVVLDCNDHPDKFKDSREILKEVNRVKPDLKVTYAYALAGGGICLHLPYITQFESALNEWPEGAFDSKYPTAHTPSRGSTCT